MTDHDHEHHHHHGDHGHHPEAPSDVEARALALESLLIQKGMLTSEDVDRIISAYEHDIGPMIGARVVARAWIDPAYRKRLLKDGPAAVRELGYEYPTSTELVVLESSAAVHHMVVCTLCSCFPWAVLGLPPTWYKSAPYRSRAISDTGRRLEHGLIDADHPGGAADGGSRGLGRSGPPAP